LPCILVASVLMLSVALAESNLEVDATVEPASYIGLFPSSVYLSPPTTGQIGTWTGQLPLEFGENTQESLIISDFAGGRLVNGDTPMQNKLNMAWEPDGGIPGTFVSIPDGYNYVYVQEDFAPGEYAGNLDFKQEVTYADPVGEYSGSMTLFVGTYEVY
jgi:hypothetical protein